MKKTLASLSLLLASSLAVAQNGKPTREQTIDYIQANHPKNISAFVFEPMLGEGGFKFAPREYFVPMLEFCREHKIAVWADEVQTFMRTGELFAFETLKIGGRSVLVCEGWIEVGDVVD